MAVIDATASTEAVRAFKVFLECSRLAKFYFWLRACFSLYIYIHDDAKIYHPFNYAKTLKDYSTLDPINKHVIKNKHFTLWSND